MIYVVIVGSFLLYTYLLADRAFTWGYKAAFDDMDKIMDEIAKKYKNEN